jgi:hypothetical protein
LSSGLTVLLLLSSAGGALAQVVDQQSWVTDGGVTAIARSGGTIYIGGGFNRVSPAMGSGVAIDASTGVAQQPFPRVTGNVYAVAPDGIGGWFLGGEFTAVSGQPRQNLAHLDGAGNLTAWKPDANGTVHALAVSGGTVYAAGLFTRVGGQARGRIAALDGASGAVTAWDPDADNVIYALAASGGVVYAGGEFNNIGGQSRMHIAALSYGERCRHGVESERGPPGLRPRPQRKHGLRGRRFPEHRRAAAVRDRSPRCSNWRRNGLEPRCVRLRLRARGERETRSMPAGSSPRPSAASPVTTSRHWMRLPCGHRLEPERGRLRLHPGGQRGHGLRRRRIQEHRGTAA